MFLFRPARLVEPCPQFQPAPPDRTAPVAIGEDHITCVEIAYPGSAGILVRLYDMNRPPDPIRVRELHCLYGFSLEAAYQGLEEVWKSHGAVPLTTHSSGHLVTYLHNRRFEEVIRTTVGKVCSYFDPTGETA